MPGIVLKASLSIRSLPCHQMRCVSFANKAKALREKRETAQVHKASSPKPIITLKQPLGIKSAAAEKDEWDYSPAKSGSSMNRLPHRGGRDHYDKWCDESGTLLLNTILSGKIPENTQSRLCRNNHRWCHLCCTDIPEANWPQHLTGSLHSRNLFRIRAVRLREQAGHPAPHPPTGVNLSSTSNWCSACGVAVEKHRWSEHIQLEDHLFRRDQRVSYFTTIVPPGEGRNAAASKKW